MTNYAVLMGNSEFPNAESLKQLSCPPADVEGMKTVLTAENRGQFLAEHVIVLLNKESKEVAREINRVLKNATKQDLVLFYYSGHGLTSGVQNNLLLSTLDTDKELLESTTISFNQIYEWINRFYCKKIVIILDCCYSGAAGKVFSKSDLDSELQILNNQATGTLLITAASENQVAIDRNEGSQFSLFTKYFIAGLETGEADKDDDGLISVDDIFRYVAKKLRFENAQQMPRKFGQESGELFIAKSGRDSRKERAEKIRLLLLKIEENYEEIAEIRTQALQIIRAVTKDLSALEMAKDALLSDLLAQKLTPVSFILQWAKLDYQTPLPPVIDKRKDIILIILKAMFLFGVVPITVNFMVNFIKESYPSLPIFDVQPASPPNPVITGMLNAEKVEAKAKAAREAEEKATREAAAALKAQQVAEAQAAAELAKQKQLADAAKAEKFLAEGIALTRNHDIKAACVAFKNAADLENQEGKKAIKQDKCRRELKNK